MIVTRSPFDLRGAFRRRWIGMPSHESPLLNVTEAATYINKKKIWVYRNLRWQMPVVKIGQQIFFEKRELDAYIAGHRENPAR